MAPTVSAAALQVLYLPAQYASLNASFGFRFFLVLAEAVAMQKMPRWHLLLQDGMDSFFNVILSESDVM